VFDQFLEDFKTDRDPGHLRRQSFGFKYEMNYKKFFILNQDERTQSSIGLKSIMPMMDAEWMLVIPSITKIR
jgi:hypothetical protein